MLDHHAATGLVTVGGAAVNLQGADTTLGGTLQATGSVTVDMTAAVSLVSFSLSTASILRSDQTGMAPSQPAPELEMSASTPLTISRSTA